MTDNDASMRIGITFIVTFVVTVFITLGFVYLFGRKPNIPSKIDSEK